LKSHFSWRDRFTHLALSPRGYLIGFAALLGLFVLVPVSGVGFPQGWHDQSVMLQAIIAASKGGPNPIVQDGTIGAGVTIGVLVLSRLLSIDYAVAAVALNRIALFSAFSLLYIMVRRQVKFLPPPAYAALVVPGLFLGLSTVFYVLAAGVFSVFLFMSDIPWSHFYATGAGLLLAYAFQRLQQYLRSDNLAPFLGFCITLGFLLGLLFSLRTPEGLAMGFMLLGVLSANILLTEQHDLRWRILRFATFVPGFILPAIILNVLMVLSAGASLSPFPILYQGSEWYRVGSRVFFQYIGTRVLQLFFDPGFFNGQTWSHVVLSSYPQSPSEVWGQPLLLQVPFFIYLLIASAATIILMVRFLSTRGLRMLVQLYSVELVCAGSATGLILLYTCAVMTGGPHLLYGLVRDFMLPVMLLAFAVSPYTLARLAADGASQPRTWKAFQRPLAIGGVAFISALVFPFLAKPVVQVVCAGLEGLKPTAFFIQRKCTETKCAYSLAYVNRRGISNPAREWLAIDQACVDGQRHVFLAPSDQPVNRLMCSDGVLPADNVAVPVRSGLFGTPQAVRYRPVAGDVAVRMDFSDHGASTGTGYKVAGWSHPEEFGTWTVGERATVVLHLRHPADTLRAKPLQLKTKVLPYLSANNVQPIKVTINGVQAANWIFEQGDQFVTRSIRVPEEALASGQEVFVVTFEIAVPTSPQSLGRSDDARPLGLAVQWVKITEGAAPASNSR
jgi:hypothetical protein